MALRSYYYANELDLNFPFSIELETFVPESPVRFRWAEKHIGTGNFRTVSSTVYGRIYYCFAKEADASFFALRWA